MSTPTRTLPPQSPMFVVTEGPRRKWQISGGYVVFTVGTQVPFIEVPKQSLDYPVGHPGFWVWVAVSWDFDDPEPWLPKSAVLGTGDSLPADTYETQHFPVARVLGRAVLPLLNYGAVLVGMPNVMGKSMVLDYLPAPSGATAYEFFDIGLHRDTAVESYFDAFRTNGTTYVRLNFLRGMLFHVDEGTESWEMGYNSGYARGDGVYREDVLGPDGGVRLYFVRGGLVHSAAI